MADWDDLRLFLAVHRAGTLSAAARALGVDQSTVSRRVAALAQRFGAALLERRDGRYALTAAGRAALGHAERVEREVDALLRQVEHLDERPQGSVRLSAPEGLGLAVIAPRLEGFARRHPGLELVLSAESAVVNLSRREADLALRFVRPHQRELVVRRVARIPFSLFASAEYLRRHPRQGRGPVLPGDDLVALHEELAGTVQSDWLRGAGRDGRVRVRVRTTLAAQAAVAAGAGIGFLPSYLGAHPALRALGAPLLVQDVFLVFHRALARSARVRLVAQFLVDCLEDPGGVVSA